MANWLQKGVVTVILMGLLAWFVQNGFSARPIVGYQLENCPDQIVQYEDSSQSVALGIYNSGDTDASLLLSFFGEGITLDTEQKQPYWVFDGESVSISFTALKNSEYYFGEVIVFTINESVDEFSYSYSVSKRKDRSFSGAINQFFGEIHGYYPTECYYVKSEDYVYVLVG